MTNFLRNCSLSIFRLQFTCTFHTFFFYKYYHESCNFLSFDNDEHMNPSKHQVSFISLIFSSNTSLNQSLLHPIFIIKYLFVDMVDNGIKLLLLHRVHKIRCPTF